MRQFLGDDDAKPGADRSRDRPGALRTVVQIKNLPAQAATIRKNQRKPLCCLQPVLFTEAEVYGFNFRSVLYLLNHRLFFQTPRRLRPFARLARMTARPPFVRMRTRKPWVRLRRTTEG